MPKAKRASAPKRTATDVIEPTADASESKKGTKRKASTSVDKVNKQRRWQGLSRSFVLQSATTASSSTTEISTQETEDEPSQVPATMTLKTSTRLSLKGEKASVKIASWNINGIRGWLNNGGLKYLDQEQPDIMCFQVKGVTRPSWLSVKTIYLRNWNVRKRKFPWKQHQPATSHFGSLVTPVWGSFWLSRRKTIGVPLSLSSWLFRCWSSDQNRSNRCEIRHWGRWTW